MAFKEIKEEDFADFLQEYIQQTREDKSNSPPPCKEETCFTEGMKVEEETLLMEHSDHGPTSSSKASQTLQLTTSEAEIDEDFQDYYQESMHNMQEKNDNKDTNQTVPLQGCRYGSKTASSPKMELKIILNAISGLSNMMTNTMRVYMERIDQRFNVLEARLDAVEKGLEGLQSNVLQSKSTEAEEPTLKRRRAQNPKIAEAVRRLHNSENNPCRYNPEQGLLSPHNVETTNHLREAISNSPDFSDVDGNTVEAACKTYFENVRRSYRYSKPEFSSKAEAARQSSKSRSRRKRLLEARRTVLRDGEGEIFKSATVDLMSDEEDGVVNGVAGWIVRPPPSRSQELSELCAVLQARLEANPKYHHRRLK
ncbi:uncharacterized protein LOC134453911 [Engraulis encrasicolus]|uniref:uncharacterized protein LOC134453911 n=1 Tax=Engraulis encrasicolus TaxID=184585 RepID=UPI002FCEFD53